MRLTFWKNPGKAKGMWKPQFIQEGFNVEFCFLVDLDNDGKAREILPQFGNLNAPMSWYEYKGGKWVKHEVATKSFGHGIGAGDVNGDGRADIVTGTGIGGGPRVQVFSGTDFAVLANFFAYESTFRGGVFASVGDLTGDGKAAVLTGTGVGGGPVVKAFSQASLASFNPTPTPIQSFFAFDPGFRGGVRVDSIDGKLVHSIIVSSQKQETLDEFRKPFNFLKVACQRSAVILSRSFLFESQLDFVLYDGEGSSQFMRRVRDELTLSLV